jgi:hypothetical protein
MSRRRQPFYSKPHTLNGDLLDRGLGPVHIALLDDLWRESSQGTTDGILAPSRAKSSRLWDEDAARELVIGGALRSSELSIDVVGFLDVNNSRAEIDELREKRSNAGRAGGAARANGPRLPDNTFAPTTCPVHETPWSPSKFGGLYCRQKAKDGSPADKRGYCSLTPALVQANVWNSEASVWTDEASVWKGEANEWYQRNVTERRPYGTNVTEPTTPADAPSSDSGSASRKCPDCPTGRLEPNGWCPVCRLWCGTDLTAEPTTRPSPSPADLDDLPF